MGQKMAGCYKTSRFLRPFDLDNRRKNQKLYVMVNVVSNCENVCVFMFPAVLVFPSPNPMNKLLFLQPQICGLNCASKGLLQSRPTFRDTTGPLTYSKCKGVTRASVVSSGHSHGIIVTVCSRNP